jgi:hypothetical protein
MEYRDVDFDGVERHVEEYLTIYKKVLCDFRDRPSTAVRTMEAILKRGFNDNVALWFLHYEHSIDVPGELRLLKKSVEEQGLEKINRDYLEHRLDAIKAARDPSQKKEC